MNTYRVDRNDETRTPCGMNSILYCGDSHKQALERFNHANTGLDWWNRPNNRYGIVLSKWNNNKREYVVIDSKGFSL